MEGYRRANGGCIDDLWFQTQRQCHAGFTTTVSIGSLIKNVAPPLKRKHSCSRKGLVERFLEETLTTDTRSRAFMQLQCDGAEVHRH